MSERDFDFELILGLAAGDFPPDEAAEIEAGLDDAARSELASQRAALQSIGLLRQPALAAPEQRKLRAAVRAELGIAEAQEASRRPRRRKVRWARAFPALAAAAALVVVIGVARNDGRESTPEATTTHAAAAAATAAAAPAVLPEQSGESATMTQDAAVFASTTRPAMPTTTTQTTAATQANASAADEATAETEALMEEAAAQAADSPPLTAATTAVGGGAGGAAQASFDLSLEELLELGNDEELLASFLDEYTAGAAPFPVSELGARAGRAGLVCWEAAGGAEAGRVLFAGAGLIDGSEGEAYIIEEDGAAGVRLFNAPDCTNLNP